MWGVWGPWPGLVGTTAPASLISHLLMVTSCMSCGDEGVCVLELSMDYHYCLDAG